MVNSSGFKTRINLNIRDAEVISCVATYNDIHVVEFKRDWLTKLCLTK